MKRLLFALLGICLCGGIPSCSNDDDSQRPSNLPTNPAEVEIGELVNINGIPGMVVHRTEDNHGYVLSLEEYLGIWGEAEPEIGINVNVSRRGIDLLRIVKSIAGWREKYPLFAWCDSLNEECDEEIWFIPTTEEIHIFNSRTRTWMAQKGYPFSYNKMYWTSCETADGVARTFSIPSSPYTPGGSITIPPWHAAHKEASLCARAVCEF